MAETVERSLTIRAPRERVWQTLTDPEQVGRWLLPPALGAQIKHDESGRLCVGMGPMEIPIASVEDVRPQESLTWRSWPDGLIASRLTLADDNAGTRVTVSVDGFEAFAADAREARQRPTALGWEQTLGNLEAVVAGGELPHPEGRTTALFGYRRDYNQSFLVERSIWIAAPRERVWRAVTDPAQMEPWFSPGTSWKLSAFEVGGKLFAPDPETGAPRYTQIIQTIEPLQRFTLQSEPEANGNAYVTDYVLTDEKDGTRLTIAHSGYHLDPEGERNDRIEQNGFGFGMMLLNIKAFVEGQTLPNPSGF